MTKLSRYLIGQEFCLQTDHKPLVYLQKSKHKNSRLMRWALALQDFRFNLQKNQWRGQFSCRYFVSLWYKPNCVNSNRKESVLLIRLKKKPVKKHKFTPNYFLYQKLFKPHEIRYHWNRKYW